MKEQGKDKETSQLNNKLLPIFIFNYLYRKRKKRKIRTTIESHR